MSPTVYATHFSGMWCTLVERDVINEDEMGLVNILIHEFFMSHRKRCWHQWYINDLKSFTKITSCA